MLPTPTVSLRAPLAPKLGESIAADAAMLVEAAQCQQSFHFELCDAQQWTGSPDEAVEVRHDECVARVALCVDPKVIDRRELRLLLVHGLLRLLEYDPSDPSRRGSIAAASGDGEARELAIAERSLLRRVGWEGSAVRCSTASPHGSVKDEYELLAWGITARRAPDDAWWLHDLHSHEGRRWRAAAMRRFWSTCGTPRAPPRASPASMRAESIGAGSRHRAVASALSRSSCVAMHGGLTAQGLLLSEAADRGFLSWIAQNAALETAWLGFIALCLAALVVNDPKR